LEEHYEPRMFGTAASTLEEMATKIDRTRLEMLDRFVYFWLNELAKTGGSIEDWTLTERQNTKMDDTGKMRIYTTWQFAFTPRRVTHDEGRAAESRDCTGYLSSA